MKNENIFPKDMRYLNIYIEFISNYRILFSQNNLNTYRKGIFEKKLIFLS